MVPTAMVREARNINQTSVSCLVKSTPYSERELTGTRLLQNTAALCVIEFGKLMLSNRNAFKLNTNNSSGR